MLLHRGYVCYHSLILAHHAQEVRCLCKAVYASHCTVLLSVLCCARCCAVQVCRDQEPLRRTRHAVARAEPYNYCPMLSKDVPRHSLCEVC
jgi:hypothetical protein